MLIKRALRKKSSYEISLKLDEKLGSGILVILVVKLCFSNSCIIPVSLALYVHCKCLVAKKVFVNKYCTEAS